MLKNVYLPNPRNMHLSSDCIVKSSGFFQDSLKDGRMYLIAYLSKNVNVQ